jgi:hypothetical protein
MEDGERNAPYSIQLCFDIKYGKFPLKRKSDNDNHHLPKYVASILCIESCCLTKKYRRWAPNVRYFSLTVN